MNVFDFPTKKRQQIFIVLTSRINVTDFFFLSFSRKQQIFIFMTSLMRSRFEKYALLSHFSFSYDMLQYMQKHTTAVGSKLL